MIEQPPIMPESDPDSQTAYGDTFIDNSFSIATNNVCGLCETVKQNLLMNFILEHKFDIVGLCETKLKKRTAELLYKNDTNFMFWWSCDDANQASTGVGLLVKKQYAQYIQQVDGYKGRVIYAKFYMKGRFKLMIINVYIQAHDLQPAEKADCYKFILSLLDSAAKEQCKVILLGDFNVDLKNYYSRVNSAHRLLKKFNLVKSLISRRFKDASSVFHSAPLDTWIRGVNRSRLDYIWVLRDLLPELLYSDTFSSHIYETDHKWVRAYFLGNGIFSRPSVSLMRRHQSTVSRIDYSKVTPEIWATFAEATDKFVINHPTLCAQSHLASVKKLNGVWNQIRQGIQLAADSCLPKTKLVSSEKQRLPPFLLIWNQRLRALSTLLLRLTVKKINHLEFPLTHPRHWRSCISPFLSCIFETCEALSYTPSSFSLLDLVSTSVLIAKPFIVELFKLVHVQCKVSEDQYKSAQMTFFIEQRCQDLIHNQKRMISSILDTTRRRITLDRVLVAKPGGARLLTEPDLIDEALISHFQTVAGGVHEEKVLPDQWRRQYAPKVDVKERWYCGVMSPISIDEWSSTLSGLPNGKAAGLSRVSNEMLKHCGPLMTNACRVLLNLCLVMSDIPGEWRQAMVYPIPKPKEWQCNLNNTRPITLLEVLRKALVKIVNKRLSQVLVKRSVLKGGNHAGLPGSSTMAPLRIINTIIEDAKDSNRELWLLFQDLSKAYDQVNLYMLDLAMQRIRLPV